MPIGGIFRHFPINDLFVYSDSRVITFDKAIVSISSGQRNLMKTYHNEANTSGIKKFHRKKIWTLSDKLDRFRKITILRPNIRNKLFLKLDSSKNVFNKSWCPKLIFFNENFF